MEPQKTTGKEKRGYFSENNMIIKIVVKNTEFKKRGDMAEFVYSFIYRNSVVGNTTSCLKAAYLCFCQWRL